jgi:2,4-dienoyl-CoA reductase-like NADH-dependent reductase (Old Yellow Enzyme family)
MTHTPTDPRIVSLFRPFELGTLQLANRLVMAPMTRGLSPGHVPGADVAEYYRLRAAGGTGLLITARPPKKKTPVPLPPPPPVD